MDEHLWNATVYVLSSAVLRGLDGVECVFQLSNELLSEPQPTRTASLTWLFLSFWQRRHAPKTQPKVAGGLNLETQKKTKARKLKGSFDYLLPS